MVLALMVRGANAALLSAAGRWGVATPDSDLRYESTKLFRNAHWPTELVDHRVTSVTPGKGAARVAQTYFVVDAQSRFADLSEASENVQHVVVAGGAQVLAVRFDDRKVQAAGDVFRKGVTKRSKQLGAAQLEQAKVAAVVHDAHRVAVGKQDAVGSDVSQGRRVGSVLHNVGQS
jgi:hypothetical protein